MVLISLDQAMEQVAQTRTNASGHFSFHLPDAGPHLVRATHQGVTYHSVAPAGSNSIEVRVFDVSSSTANVSVTADVMRFQAKGDELQGIRLFAVNNNSDPPRTQMHGKDFEFFLPDGAEVDQGMAKTNGGPPVNSPPVLEKDKDKNRYGFAFPIRPGETEFQVVFHMKYNGALNVDPKALHAAEHFVVMVPRTMQFTAAPGVTFQSMEDPRQSDALVRVVSRMQAGQPLNFSISGTGTLDEPGDDSQGVPHPVPDRSAATASAKLAGIDSHPNGAPSPLKRYGGYITVGFAFLVAAGVIYARTRSRAVSISSKQQLPNRASPAPTSSSRSKVLLEELKNQLFQLEMDRKQGRIDQTEYERARVVLDGTLKRAIKRPRQT